MLTALDDLTRRVDELVVRVERLEADQQAARTDRDRLEGEGTRADAPRSDQDHDDHDRLTTLEQTVTQLETQLSTTVDRLDGLEANEPDETTETHQTDEPDETHTTHDQTTPTDPDPIEARLTAHERKLAANKDRIAELQSRELEKGAHLLAATVDVDTVEVPENRLERIRKDDGRQYYRLPEQADPLERGGSVTLAYGDLLPIQQLARMDDEMLRSAANALPTRLAAKLWQARTDPSVGDDPWEPGCKDIAEYVTASDLKHWIRRQEPGISDTYAKKLVSRVIDAVLDLSNNRVAVRKRNQRKNGLEYTERRLVLPADVEIPGETTTDDSRGEGSRGEGSSGEGSSGEET
ncbi:hypothetical protein B1756_08995 [Natrarchaeobaculum aegyptiacum]|uniref:Uncharacterized protein n=1 Tax=Natrarchaeobaculum aegyptiacum TaxID=745377 RepID=A0A2Z2I1M9_9EURY|nr:hypothetical protein B1756_08995 [Natrarchaeobaculum aegyptiacum]